MDGHSHRYSTDFEQTLLSRVVTLGTRPFLVRPTLSWKEARETVDGKVRNLGPMTFCLPSRQPTVSYHLRHVPSLS